MMESSSEKTQIIVNLKGRCGLCLVHPREDDKSNSTFTLETRIFENLWSLIFPNLDGSGSKKEFAFLSELGTTSTFSNTPSVCGPCAMATKKISAVYDEVVELERRLLELRKSMGEMIGTVRRKMKEATVPSNRRKEGLNSNRFKKLLHEISGQGQRDEYDPKIEKYLESTIEYLGLVGDCKLFNPSSTTGTSSSSSLSFENFTTADASEPGGCVSASVLLSNLRRYHDHQQSLPSSPTLLDDPLAENDTSCMFDQKDITQQQLSRNNLIPVTYARVVKVKSTSNFSKDDLITPKEEVGEEECDVELLLESENDMEMIPSPSGISKAVDGVFPSHPIRNKTMTSSILSSTIKKKKTGVQVAKTIVPKSLVTTATVLKETPKITLAPSAFSSSQSSSSSVSDSNYGTRRGRVVTLRNGMTTTELDPNMTMDERMAFFDRTVNFGREKKPKIFKCTDCDLAFVCYQGLRAHRDVDHFGKFFVCDQCGDKFRYHQNLNKHKRKRCKGMKNKDSNNDKETEIDMANSDQP